MKEVAEQMKDSYNKKNVLILQQILSKEKKIKKLSNHLRKANSKLQAKKKEENN